MTRWRRFLVTSLSAAGSAVGAMELGAASWRRRLRWAVVGLALVLVTAPLGAQFPFGRDEPDHKVRNVPYDGRFTFVRVRYDPISQFGPGNACWKGRDEKWCHDYPRAERHLMRIMDELTNLGPHVTGGNILEVDDPELFRYPVAYLSEPGFWAMSEDEARSLRSYLLKGGFLILDDLAGPQIVNTQARIRQVLPNARLIELDTSHPVFNSFFDIESLEYTHPYWDYRSVFYGVFEENDPTGRLMVVINHNNDIGEYWEWSDTGFLPIDLSNEAYKLGVNYLIYAMTH